MTYPISDVTRRVVYAGNSTTGPFSFSFEIIDEGDIGVYFNTTLLTITTDYTVTINADGTGYITLVTGGALFSAPDSGDTISIFGNKGIERQTDFVTGGDLFANSLNDELDAQTIFAQQNSEAILRSLRAPVTDPTTIDMELPSKADRAGTVLGFNATTGDPEVGPNISDVSSLADITADIATLADIEDGTDATDAIQTVAGIASNVTTVANISSNITTVSGNTININNVADNINDVNSVGENISSVNTVAANIADVITVANDLNEAISEIETAANDLNEAVSEIDTVAVNIDNVNTVGTNIANVNTVAGISSDITAVAGDATDIGTVATNIASVNTVSTNIANVNAVASNATNINAVAADEVDIGTVATSIANVNTVAGSITNVNTVAGINTEVATVAGITANIGTVAGISTNVTTVAGISANVTTVATNITNVNTVASNIADVNNFAEVYRIAATAPTTSLDEGDLWYDTTASSMKVYDGASWTSAYVPSGAYVLTTGDTMTGDLSFGDNVKAIFGTGNDLSIYHDGSDSYVRDAGTGDFLLGTDGSQIRFYDFANARDMATMVTGGACSFKHGATTRLATTSTGVDVTGTVTADGLTVASTVPSLILNESDTTNLNTRIVNNVGDFNIQTWSDAGGLVGTRFNIDHATGDISFYEDTGTTPKFFWDAADERLGIKTSFPTTHLTIGSIYGVDGIHLTQQATDADYSGRLFFSSNSATAAVLGRAGGLAFTTGATVGSSSGTERMRIDSSGNVGIGNTNPSSHYGEANRLVVQESKNGATILGIANSTVGASANVQLKQIGGTANSYVTSNLSDNNGNPDYSYTFGSGVNHVKWDIGGSEALRINSLGNVGIGTTSPNTILPLTIEGAVSGIQFNDTNGENFNIVIDSGNMRFQQGTAGSAPTERMRIDSSGNVGIGTSSPSSKLDVAGDITITDNTSYFKMYSAGSVYGYRLNANISDTVDGGFNIQNINGTNLVSLDYAANFKFNSGYGSAATAYGCRAWVNFNGTGTPSIREDGNVSSITDNGTGYYSVNFTTAMPDANYAASITATDNDGSGGTDGYGYSCIVKGYNSLSTTTLSFAVGYPANSSRYDNDRIMVAVHR